MDINEAKKYANSFARLSWSDRNGEIVTDEVYVLEVNFVPFYGPCFITSKGDIRLDRVTGCSFTDQRAA